MKFVWNVIGSPGWPKLKALEELVAEMGGDDRSLEKLVPRHVVLDQEA